MTGQTPRPENLANTPQPDWEAIARFLAGESPADEAVRVAKWLDAHPDDRALVEQLNREISPPVPADVDIEAALRQAHQRMVAPARAPHLAVERNRERRPRTFMVAALLAAAAGFAAFVVLRDDPPTSAPESASAVLARSYATTTGQRDSVVLSDGSRVVLGPNSRLNVPSDFGVSGRSVQLEGDGYFDVRHDAAKPFMVRVANGIVEDVGTTFTIESDAADATMVSVLSGSVRLRLSSAPTSTGAVLAAGDRGALTADGQVRTFQNVVVSDDSAWTSGRLVFRDASIARVSAELRRWYGVGLFLADSSLRSRTVTTTIDQSQPIDQVLKILALTLGARVERQGDSATFHAQRGSSTVR